jgi:2-oxoglutarate dehydrogenase E1 component
MNFSFSLNAEYIDSQYKKWKSDPDSVSPNWQAFFEGFELSAVPERVGAGFCAKSDLLRQCNAQELIYRYRDLGHLLACLDPLGQCPTSHSLLDLPAFGLSDSDLDRQFYAPPSLFPEQASLRDILSVLRETYCRSVGVEYMHLQDPNERLWLQERMEPNRNRPNCTNEEKLYILNKLCQATLFEQFLHTRYIGQKRFSLEGAEVVIPLLGTLLGHAQSNGCREIVMGMAHRGRLNIQVNVLNKLYESVFCEFEEHYDPQSIFGAGDVKYHRGYMAEVEMGKGRPILVLIPNNPSHLEAVDPVLEGIVHARQERLKDTNCRLVLPLLIHGDAAFAGQGIVTETLNLSQLEGYSTGGTLHIVINNQIGFTTLPEHAHSTRYATDIAKMLMVPIFHVHGEDPETAVSIMKLAFDYRAEFKKDVVIDVVCYRRYGHNEGDEPYYTQPEMYERIKDRPPLYRIYAQKLIESGVIGEEGLKRIGEGINECLELGYRTVHEKTCRMPDDRFYDVWEGTTSRYPDEGLDTGVSGGTLLDLARKLNTVPQGFSVHPRLIRILNRRLETIEKGEGIDWATAEALAFATLLIEGTPIRLSGQDSSRGTFSQRHSVLSDVKTGEHYVPLNHLTQNQASFHVYDSMLSENAVLGFEYGYSLVSPETLVIWEAQFGDFANNAQPIFDQFVSSAEFKWHRLSGLTALLPHGLEGQGPEHSSARVERFLQLCAEDNIQVCYPTTPAQYFHLLRRQMRRKVRKPLIALTPKSLLRHPAAVSGVPDLAESRFNEVLGDPGFEGASRVLLCSGKIYYELAEARKTSGDSDTAILRIEQFYPFQESLLRKVLSDYAAAALYWVQEEPENMGGWNFMRWRLKNITGVDPGYIGRPAAASPASGYLTSYKREQGLILATAFPAGSAGNQENV